MKTVLFVFNGDPMCFIHVLLNALDMHAAGHQTCIVMEGASVALVPALVKPEHPLANLFTKVRAAGLLDGACKACSVKLGVAAEVEAAGVALIGEMHGHPSMRSYMDAGWQVITF
ncbi:MAG: cytoplasmic protein [Desulfomicrobium sp.]|nr:cytoplasmic protein [Pseudomonadota bacterium]MBV1711727.1 cytoplasmic protein [Desulfomicrobium sp.]MBU4572685.1 cytoplasmic protein [Pseudomonadota bacterium]MBU4593534.1 cytoplasmic protein [Pseudomonadota bacterium]MBV1720456.1 cytoplasmic protein [Desulfomicrobium sp.]